METASPLAGCGEIDSFEHVLQCTGAGPIPNDAGGLVSFLAGLAVRSCPNNPGFPTHCAQQEIFIDAQSASSATPSISFERDSPRPH